MDNNLYRAPQSSNFGRNLSDRISGGVNAVMIEILSSGSIWARITSIVAFINFLIVLAYFGFMCFMFISVANAQARSGSLGALIFAIGILFLLFSPALISYWFMGSSMNRYAKASKKLRSNGDENEVEECFASSSTFLKALAIFLLLMFVLMFIVTLAAIALPAYQDYVTRARMR